MKRNLLNLALEDWQKANCKNCYFAEAKKVGTGNPCCTYPYSLVHSPEGQCLSKRLGRPRL